MQSLRLTLMNERELEQQALVKAKHRYHTTVSHYRENSQETETAVGRLALSSLSPFVEAELSKWKVKAVRQAGRGHAAFPLIDAASTQKTALLISRAVLDTLTTAKSITSLHMTIGKALADESLLELYRAANPPMYDYIRRNIYADRGDQRKLNYLFQAMRKQMAEVESPWTVEDRVRAGCVGLELFIRATGVVEVQTAYDSRRRRNHSTVVATEAMLDWLHKAHEFREELRPLFTPMVVEPTPWTSATDGGLLLSNLTLIKSEQSHPELTPASAPTLFSAVNRVQSTGWSVNQEVLKVAQHLYENDVAVPGLPSREPIPFPTVPADISTNEEARKSHGAEKARIRAANNKRRNRQLVVARLLQLAEEYCQYPTFYFCQQLDFRGRFYSLGTGLNNQGDDLSRSMLQFNVGKQLTTDEQFRFYRIQGANHYGLTHLSLEDRVQWVEDNITQIFHAGLDPLSHMAFWAEAKSPWQFLAWILDYSAILVDPLTPSHLPCSIDGTNNGCQIWSMVMRDQPTGVATNCTNNEQPQDLYAQVADAVLDTMEEGFFAHEWRKIGIDRSTVKGAVMVIPYSATLTGVSNTIYEWLQKKREDAGINPAWKSDFLGSNFLAQQVWRVLPDLIPAVLEGKAYLQHLVTLAAAEGAGVSWDLPSGFRVENRYMKKTLRKVHTNLGKRYHVSYVQTPTPALSSRRQRQTITANYTHSLDSALLTATVCAAKEVTHFSMVHDSYGCHAADLPAMALAVRQSAAELFNRNLLQELRDGLSKQLPEVCFPQPPQLGTLNPREVLDSRYFFN